MTGHKQIGSIPHYVGNLVELSSEYFLATLGSDHILYEDLIEKQFFVKCSWKKDF